MILNAVEVPSFLHSSLGGLVDSVLDMLSDGRELNSWQIHGVYPRHLHIQTPLRRMAGVLTHEGHPWALTIPGGKPSRVVSYTAHIQHIVRIELATLDHRAFLFSTLNVPNLVRSARLNHVDCGEYLDGWPPGNTGCWLYRDQIPLKMFFFLLLVQSLWNFICIWKKWILRTFYEF